MKKNLMNREKSENLLLKRKMKKMPLKKEKSNKINIEL
jgi:hypothetical protein